MKGTKEQKGITLIALIITIVVLLILAAVAINTIQNDGVIQYAQNATVTWNQVEKNEQGTLQEYEDMLIAANGGFEEYKVGDVVTIGTESFYVIKDSAKTESKLVLLAKNNLKADELVQDPTGAINPCAFSTVENLSFTSGEDLNKNSTVKADPTSAVYKAIKYGETLGVTTGRLMLISEADALYSANSDILYGRNGKSSGEYLNYWLGSEDFNEYVSWVDGYYSEYNSTPYWYDGSCGVRPVIEISKSKIS